MKTLKTLLFIFIASISIMSCDNDETTDMSVSKSDITKVISDIAIEFVQGITETDDLASRAVNTTTIDNITKVPLTQVSNLQLTRSTSDNYVSDTVVAASLSNRKGTVILIKDNIDILPIAYFKKKMTLILKKSSPIRPLTCLSCYNLL